MPAVDRREFYSRKQVASLLNVTQAHVYQSIEQKGLLRAVRENGRVGYRRAEVDAFVPTYRRTYAPKNPNRKERSWKETVARGALAAKLFPLFRQSYSIADAVIETGADPVLVRELRREYDLTYEAGEAAIAQAKLEQKLAREERAAERERFRLQKRTAVTSAFGISARKTA